MQVTREIQLFRRMFSDGVTVAESLNEMKIPFSPEAQESLKPKLSDEESTLQAKSHWRTLMGKPKKST